MIPSSPSPHPLVERKPHLARIDDVLTQSAAASGQLLWIEGPAGSGKTSLLRAAVRRAAEKGMTVLACTGEELESKHLLGLVHQLVDEHVRGAPSDAQTELFAGPARAVRRAMYDGGSEDDEDGAAVDRVASGLQTGALHHGLLWLLTRIGANGPMLIVADDLQWGDPASLSFIAYLARRLEGTSIALIVASRTAVDNETSALRDRIRALDHAHHLSPPALSAQAVAALVRERVPGADDATCRSVFEASGGNPFLAEVAGQMLRSADPADSSSLPAPGRLLQDVQRRLAALPGDVQLFAKALAVLGVDRPISTAARVAAMGLPEALDASAALHAAEWIERDEAAAATDPVVRLRHPLVRDAVVQLCSPSELDRLHARALDVLFDAGAEPEEIAVHAFASVPRGSEATVEILRQAAVRANRSGAPAEALGLLRRCLAEPPTPEHRRAVLDQMTRAAVNVDAPDLDDLFVEAVAAAEHATGRNRVRLRWARLLVGRQRSGDAVRLLDQALAEDDGADPVLHAEILCSRVVALRMDPAQRSQWEASLAALGEIDLDPRSWAARGLRAELSYHRGVVGQGLEAAQRWIGEALEEEDSFELAFRHPQAFATAMHALLMVNDFERARIVAGRALQAAQEAGYAPTFRLASAYLAIAELRLGRSLDAIEHAVTDTATERHLTVLVPLNAVTTARAYLALGRIDDAEKALALPGGWGRFQFELTFGGVPEMLGWVRLAQNRPVEAEALFMRLADGTQSLGGANPATSAWRTGAARASLASGDAKRAVRLSDAELELARAWGAPRPLGIALSTAARLRSGQRAGALHDEAVAVLEAGSDPYPRGWALLERGRHRRGSRQKVAAREDFRQALDIGHRHDFVLMADRAHDALLDAGGRPRSRALSGLGALTPAELRVARAAAHGQSNADIAAALFTSRKTVEYHLSNVYRKLQITGRGELPPELRAPTEEPW